MNTAWKTVIVMTMIIVFASCATSPFRAWTRKTSFGPEYLHSENPIEQVKAITTVAQKKDPNYLPDLVELLSHEDPSVRDHAYAAVVEITGKSTPTPQAPVYRYYEGPQDRKPAVDAWSEYAQALAGKGRGKGE